MTLLLGLKNFNLNRVVCIILISKLIIPISGLCFPKYRYAGTEWTLLLPVLRILDVYPGSCIRIFSIPYPGSASKNLCILTQKMVHRLSEIWSWLFNTDLDPGSRSWLFTHPGSRIQGSKRHRIPDPQHWFLRRLAVRQAQVQFSPRHPLGSSHWAYWRWRWRGTSANGDGFMNWINAIEWVPYCICTKIIKINKWFIKQKRKGINTKYSLELLHFISAPNSNSGRSGFRLKRENQFLSKHIWAS